MMTQKEFLKQFPGGKIEGKWLVYDILDCSHRSLKELPEYLKADFVECSHNQIVSLPDNMKVKDLWCSYNKLVSLPDNLKADLVDCSQNQIVSLPSNLKVNRLWCYNNPLRSVPEYIKDIPFVYIFPNVSWNDPVMINRVLSDDLSAEEVFSIENTEHRRIAYERMDKAKMKTMKPRVIDRDIDDQRKPMKIVSVKIKELSKPLLFYVCVDASSSREYWLHTDKRTCREAKAGGFGFGKEEVVWIREW